MLILILKQPPIIFWPTVSDKGNNNEHSDVCMTTLFSSLQHYLKQMKT